MLSTKSTATVVLCAISTSLCAQTITNLIPAAVGFVDISTNGGTQLTSVLGNTEQNVWSTVGNLLFPAGLVRIGDNGVIVATSTTGDVHFNNTPILATGVPSGLTSGNGIICAFWDDLAFIPAGLPAGSIWWKVDSGVLYILWKDVYHEGQAAAGQVITFEIQVFDAPAPGTPAIQILYPDSAFGGSAAAFDAGASATVGYVKGLNANGNNSQWSFDTPSVPSGTVLSIFIVPPPMLAVASSPLGSGSIKLDIAFGPPAGTYFLAATFVRGAYPNGWLFGVDMTYAELATELAAGFPFNGTLDASGGFVLGPFGGLPPVTVYAIVFGFPPGSPVPTVHTAAIEHTIP